jgi:hypothetical protein
MNSEDAPKQSSKITQLLEAATKAASTEKFIRQYEGMMKAAGLGLHQAAFGAAQEAAFSQDRRLAEMARPGLPDFTSHIREASQITLQLSEAAVAATKFSQIEKGFQAWRSQISNYAALVPPSLTEQSLSSFRSELTKALDFGHIFEEARNERLNPLQEILRTASTPSLPAYIEHPIALSPPRRERVRVNPSAQFMESFQHQYNQAVKQAEEEGSAVVVSSKTPTGDLIRVAQLSSVDEHFILVRGFDQDRRPRSFKANCGGVDLAIEIVSTEEDYEEENPEDNDLVH